VPTRRLPIVLTILVAIIAALLLPTSVGAETDAERERERVRQEQAAAAANVDALEAEQSEVMAAIADLEEQVAAEEAALASAEREVDEAEAAQARAQEGIEDAEAHLAELEERLREQMVESYTASDGGAGSVAVLDADNATDMVKRRAILDVRSAEDDDLVDQVRAAQAELRVQRREAEAAEERAAARRAEVEERLASVEAARDQQAAFAAQVEDRIDNETARALELGEQEADLSAEILREQAEARAILLWQQQEAQRREDAAAAAAAAAAQPSGPAYDDDGRETDGPVADPPPPASAPPSGGPVGSGNGVSLCNAAGITVNCQIASQVTAMVNAAAAAGVSLSGGGYRDPSRQIELRRQNCGSSYYAIWEMPSSQCSPPTARPGSSQHELGLAIDFSNCSRSSACFSWLSGNASSYGMYNLPSESWHWSVNGN
jgi:peptidoglycan hydrolase CwlO-like protein